MRYAILSMMVLLNPGIIQAQDKDTSMLHYAASKYDTIVYKRIIRFDQSKHLYHVRAYYENGQIQMKLSLQVSTISANPFWFLIRISCMHSGPSPA